MKVRMSPVYLPPNFIGREFLGPIAWEAEFDLSLPHEPKQLLSVAEAAKLMGYGRTVVNEMTNDGTLPCVVVRGTKKIRRDDLDAFVKHGPRKRRKATS